MHSLPGSRLPYTSMGKFTKWDLKKGSLRESSELSEILIKLERAWLLCLMERSLKRSSLVRQLKSLEWSKLLILLQVLASLSKILKPDSWAGLCTNEVSKPGLKTLFEISNPSPLLTTSRQKLRTVRLRFHSNL